MNVVGWARPESKPARIAGGANAIVQYLKAGLVDELGIELAPVVCAGGIALFDGLDTGRIGFEPIETFHSFLVTIFAVAFDATKRGDPTGRWSSGSPDLQRTSRFGNSVSDLDYGDRGVSLLEASHRHCALAGSCPHRWPKAAPSQRDWGDSDSGKHMG